MTLRYILAALVITFTSSVFALKLINTTSDTFLVKVANPTNPTVVGQLKPSPATFNVEGLSSAYRISLYKMPGLFAYVTIMKKPGLFQRPTCSPGYLCHFTAEGVDIK